MRDVATGKDLADVVKWVKFSGASLTPDGKGFFYSRYDEPTDATKMRRRELLPEALLPRIGTPQTEDELVYERPDQKEWGFGGDGHRRRALPRHPVWQGTERKNRIFYKDLQAKPTRRSSNCCDDFDAEYNFIDNDGPIFWFQTDLDAPRGRVIAIDVTKPERENWKVVVPEATDTLEGVGTRRRPCSSRRT